MLVSVLHRILIPSLQRQLLCHQHITCPLMTCDNRLLFGVCSLMSKVVPYSVACNSNEIEYIDKKSILV